MKKSLIVLFLIVSACNISAQKKFQFELSTGITLSVPKTSRLLDKNIEGAPVIESSLNVGAFVLPSLNYVLDDKSSLDFGLGFSFDRFSIVEKIGFSKYDGNRNVLHLQTPINYNFHLGNDKTYVLGVGAFANILLSAKEKGVVSVKFENFNSPDEVEFQNEISKEYDRNVKEYFNPFSFGAFVQLKKYLSFSPKLKGFILFKINQHINTMNKPDNDNMIYSLDSEKEPTIINLGVGIRL